jgi:CDP-diacylglycerol---glycerol-3-phosphate 3-phosphatidyltransferase
MARQAKLRFVTILTLARFPLVLLFFAGALVFTENPRPWLFVASFTCLVTAAVTDLLDGYFARRLNVQTPFGAHVDPLMDKFFYLSTLPLLVFVAMHGGHTRHATFLLVLTMLFLTRDQWVTFLRSIGSIYNVSGGALWMGKLRTSFNFPLICAIYYVEAAPPAWQFVRPPALYAFEVVALAINLLSIYTYTRRYWPYLRQAATVPPAGGATQA